jgi:hypothetical protein
MADRPDVTLMIESHHLVFDYLGSRIDGSEQRIDGLPRHLTDEGIVMLSLFGPTSALELFKRLALLLADGHLKWLPVWADQLDVCAFAVLS